MSGTARPALPEPRGPISEAVIHALARQPHAFRSPWIEDLDVLTSDDAQLALACCYELHYESFRDVDDEWEWSPDLLALRRRLERGFVRRLVDEVGAPDRIISDEDVVPALNDLTTSGGGVSLSGYMLESGTIAQLQEFCVHRSEYQRKEADPHTWMIPRLRGRSKAAAVTIQYDEYGEGRAEAMHAELFGSTMRALGLDSTYGAYRDLLPAATLATGNLVTMFGLHRQWRAACIGHLALFEMTSVGPMSRYSRALDRFGIALDGRQFYDVHVEADAWHEQIAQTELVAGFLEHEPGSGGTVMFGARALMEVERRFSEHLLNHWSAGQSSLLAPVAHRSAA